MFSIPVTPVTQIEPEERSPQDELVTLKPQLAEAYETLKQAEAVYKSLKGLAVGLAQQVADASNEGKGDIEGWAMWKSQNTATFDKDVVIQRAIAEFDGIGQELLTVSSATVTKVFASKRIGNALPEELRGWGVELGNKKVVAIMEKKLLEANE